MAIQIDYFIAPTDDAAAATADLEAGPRSESSDVVGSNDVDPGFGLGYLDEVLVGTSLEDYLEQDGPVLIARSTDEQKVVLELDGDVVERLAGLTGPFEELASRWAAHETPPDAETWAPRARDLVEFLDGFTALARRSRDGEGSVYCWLWP